MANGNWTHDPDLEALACIAFKQSISQAAIDHLINADKRGFVVISATSSSLIPT